MFIGLIVSGTRHCRQVKAGHKTGHKVRGNPSPAVGLFRVTSGPGHFVSQETHHPLSGLFGSPRVTSGHFGLLWVISDCRKPITRRRVTSGHFGSLRVTSGHFGSLRVTSVLFGSGMVYDVCCCLFCLSGRVGSRDPTRPGTLKQNTTHDTHIVYDVCCCLFCFATTGDGFL